MDTAIVLFMHRLVFDFINKNIDKDGFLSLDEILDLQNFKNINICAHGFSHTSLSIYKDDMVMKNPIDGEYRDSPRGSKNLISENEVKFQINESKKDFDAKGIRTDIFIYPYGIYNNVTAGMVKDGKFSLAYTCDDGLDDYNKKIFTKPRFIINSNTNLDNLQKRIKHRIL